MMNTGEVILPGRKGEEQNLQELNHNIDKYRMGDCCQEKTDNI